MDVEKSGRAEQREGDGTERKKKRGKKRARRKRPGKEEAGVVEYRRRKKGERERGGGREKRSVIRKNGDRESRLRAPEDARGCSETPRRGAGVHVRHSCKPLDASDEGRDVRILIIEPLVCTTTGVRLAK